MSFWRLIKNTCRNTNNKIERLKFETQAFFCGDKSWIQGLRLNSRKKTACFPDVPEFYATNMLMNVKNHRIYSSKFKLSVVDLTKIELATEEDKTYHIDYWARLFKAKTWEDIQMLAEKNEYLKEAAQSVYVANADEMVRQKCRAREDAERHERTMKRNMNLLKQENETLKEQYELQTDCLDEQSVCIFPPFRSLIEQNTQNTWPHATTTS